MSVKTGANWRSVRPFLRSTAHWKTLATKIPTSGETFSLSLHTHTHTLTHTLTHTCLFALVPPSPYSYRIPPISSSCAPPPPPTLILYISFLETRNICSLTYSNGKHRIARTHTHTHTHTHSGTVTHRVCVCGGIRNWFLFAQWKKIQIKWEVNLPMDYSIWIAGWEMRFSPRPFVVFFFNNFHFYFYLFFLLFFSFLISSTEWRLHCWRYQPPEGIFAAKGRFSSNSSSKSSSSSSSGSSCCFNQIGWLAGFIFQIHSGGL